MIKSINNTLVLFQNTFIQEKRCSQCYLFNCLKNIFNTIAHFFASFFSKKSEEHLPQIKSSESSKSDKPIKKKYIDRKISATLLAPEWKQIIPKSRGAQGSGSLSHLREVYLSQKQQWVVKISSEVDRKRKGSNNAWPYAEEIAYKINKLFAWKSIPKTKIIHGSQLINNAKEKYINIQNSMTIEPLPNIDRFTFTFQKFVTGKTLPRNQTNHQKIKDQSYQKAYLLNMILGKKDARADNSMYDLKKRKIFEVDNESLGSHNYSIKGVLRRFKKLQKKTIIPDILDNILDKDLQNFENIRTKYKTKDLTLLNLWLVENPSSTKTSEDKINQYWNTIEKNFVTLKTTIQILQKTHKKITVKRLEKAYIRARTN